jgi:phosphoenolpyruvate carboxykinase (ATP)
VGGPYGVGKRISIRHTRNLLNAALNGDLNNVEYYVDPVFNYEVPRSCPNVPEAVMYPAKAWTNQDDYQKRYRQLASRFIDNMKKFEVGLPREILDSGPKI